MIKSELVYITLANLKRITKRINLNASIVVEGSIYKEFIPFFNKKEEYRLLLIQKMLRDLNVFITEYYNRADLLDYEIYTEPIHPPAYHNNFSCTALHSNFINYRIPQEIKVKGSEKISEYRKWFLDNKYLLEKNSEIFKEKMNEAFGVNTFPDQINFENSGVTTKQNYDLVELEKKIDELLFSAKQYYSNSDPKKQLVISKYQKFTYLAYSDKELFVNDTSFSDKAIKEFLKQYEKEFKTPIKELLIEYYRVLYNKELKFQNYLLEQLGFNPCGQCYK